MEVLGGFASGMKVATIVISLKIRRDLVEQPASRPAPKLVACLIIVRAFMSGTGFI